MYLLHGTKVLNGVILTIVFKLFSFVVVLHFGSESWALATRVFVFFLGSC